jgi:hypothetical protein
VSSEIKDLLLCCCNDEPASALLPSQTKREDANGGCIMTERNAITTRKKQMQSNAYQNKRASYIQTNVHKQHEEPNVT